MTEKMRKEFAEIERRIQAKRAAHERVGDFDPVYIEFDDEEARLQGRRCIQCPIDILRGLESEFEFCRTGCPLHNRIPVWIKKTREGDIEGAFHASNETSPFPEILGRVCPHDNLCQGSCTIARTEFGSVTIGAIEVYLNEAAFEKGLRPYYGEDKRRRKRVAVIGSGPAGMSCATFLLRGGVAVEMFEKSDRPGGLLTYGIPNFKIDKSVVLRRFEWMQKAGLKLHLHTPIETHEEMKRLLEEFDAVFIGVGAPKGKGARMENEEAFGVYQVMDILTHSQKAVFGDSVENILEGKDVVVLGGGDSAMDAVRTSVRLGAKSVTCVYRRDAENMPGSAKERINAEEEGVRFRYYTAPKSVIVDDENRVKGLVCQKTELGEPAEDGRRRLQVIDGSDFEIACDVIILALGFDNHRFDWFETARIETDKWGCPLVDRNKRTSNPKVYAGGDAVRGADLAVTAAADGRTAAEAILVSLGMV
ncbi:FAD-dependent oxidoreductase [Hydrogenimonas sp.]